MQQTVSAPIPLRHTLRNTQCLMDWLNSSGYIFIHPAADPPVSGVCLIETLPLELFCSITTHVSFKDKMALSLVDKLFRSAVFGQVFASIRCSGDEPINSGFSSVCKSLVFNSRHHTFSGERDIRGYLATWKQVAHIGIDSQCNLTEPFPRRKLFPGIKSASFFAAFESGGEDRLHSPTSVLQILPEVEGLGISISSEIHTSKCLQYAAAKLKLKTLHLNKRVLRPSDVHDIARMFPVLKTLILEGAICNNMFGDLLLAVQSMPQLEVLVFPKGSIRHPSGIIYNLFRHSTLRRIVAVEEPEHYTKVAELHQPAGEGTWTYKQKSFATFAFWRRNYANKENIYSREFKWAVGAWPEGAPSPLDVL